MRARYNRYVVEKTNRSRLGHAIFFESEPILNLTIPVDLYFFFSLIVLLLKTRLHAYTRKGSVLYIPQRIQDVIHNAVIAIKRSDLWSVSGNG